MNLLILLYLILYIGLAVIRLDWAVMLLLATLPTYLIRWQVFNIPFTLLEAMILVTFFIWFVSQTEFRNFIKGRYSWQKFKENKLKRGPYPFALEIILLLIISFIAVAVAGFSNSALGIWKAYFFEPLLLFILILNIFQGKQGIKKIFWSLAISALFVSALAIYQKFTGVWIFNEFWAAIETRRITSFFGYPNAVGLYLGPLILVMFGWMAHRFRKTQITDRWLWAERLFIILTIVVSVLAVYFAKSKGALAGVMVGLIIFVLLAGGKKIRWTAIVLILVAVIGISVYTPLRSYTLDKTVYSKSLQIRQAQWAETWQMLKDGRIISGAGLANYQNIIAPYHQEGIFLKDYQDPDWHRKTVFNAEYRQKVWQPLEIYLYPHNIFLNFWSELGLAGLLLFIWIIGKYFYIGISNLKQKRNKYIIIGLIGAMVVIIVHGLVDVPYFKNDLAMMFWLLIAMMSMCRITHNA